MGRLLALQLTDAGHKVTLFDQKAISDTDSASFTAAGMLTPYAEIETAEIPIFAMGQNSIELWKKLVKRLGDHLGFYQYGSLMVAHGSDQADLLSFNQRLNSKLADAAASVKPMLSHDLAALEPELVPTFRQATFLPDEAWLCSHRVMNRLATELLELDVCWYSKTSVTGVSAHTIQTAQQSFHFDWAIDARGLGAKSQWSELRAVRGELIELQAPEVTIRRMVRLMHPRYRLYLVPQFSNDRYLIGATQIESNDTGPITVRSTMELLSAVYSIHPGFAEARVLNSRTQCRPALNNNLPLIKTSDGIIRVNGLFRHGYLLAPTLAQEIVNWINSSVSYQSSYTKLFQQVA